MLAVCSGWGQNANAQEKTSERAAMVAFSSKRTDGSGVPKGHVTTPVPVLVQDRFCPWWKKIWEAEQVAWTEASNSAENCITLGCVPAKLINRQSHHLHANPWGVGACDGFKGLDKTETSCCIFLLRNHIALTLTLLPWITTLAIRNKSVRRLHADLYTENKEDKAQKVGGCWLPHMPEDKCP